jgi:hypothetical protein
METDSADYHPCYAQVCVSHQSADIRRCCTSGFLHFCAHRGSSSRPALSFKGIREKALHTTRGQRRQNCRSAQSILQLCLTMLLSYAQHLCSILQHMRGSHENMRKMMVEERFAYFLENCLQVVLVIVSYLPLQSPLHLQTVLSTLV